MSFRNLVENILIDGRIHRRFEKYEYFDRAETDDLIRIFYNVGFIGYQLDKVSKPHFVLDDPQGDRLLEARHYVIHRAFWKALGVREPVPLAT